MVATVDDVRDAITAAILAGVSITGWTTYVNENWYEVSNQRDRQIWYSTADPKYENVTLYEQKAMDRATSGKRYENTLYLYVGAPTKAQREELSDAIRDLFPLINPTTSIDAIIIESDITRDLDKKANCLAYERIFEITSLF